MMVEDKRESSPLDLNYNCYAESSIPKEHFDLNLRAAMPDSKLKQYTWRSLLKNGTKAKGPSSR